MRPNEVGSVSVANDAEGGPSEAQDKSVSRFTISHPNQNLNAAIFGRFFFCFQALIKVRVQMHKKRQIFHLHGLEMLNYLLKIQYKKRFFYNFN